MFLLFCVAPMIEIKFIAFCTREISQQLLENNNNRNVGGEVQV